VNPACRPAGRPEPLAQTRLPDGEQIFGKSPSPFGVTGLKSGIM